MFLGTIYFVIKSKNQRTCAQNVWTKKLTNPQVMST